MGSRWLVVLALAACSSPPGAPATPAGSDAGASLCGNGSVDPGEECDEAAETDNGECLSTCLLATCGDGHVFLSNEMCDDGPLNSGTDPYACQPDCTICLCDYTFGAECMYGASGELTCGSCSDHAIDVNGNGSLCLPVLDDLQVSAGALDPSFQRDRYAYTVALDATVGEIQITPITVWDVSVSPDAATSPHSLRYASNPFAIDVGPHSRLQRTVVLVQRGLSYARLTAWNAGPNDGFGGVVAADGDTIAVAASGEDNSAQGIGATTDDDDAPDSGAVYIFRNGGSGWALEAYIKASDSSAGLFFGQGLWQRGDWLGVVGHQIIDNVGDTRIYLFHRTGTTWTQVSELVEGWEDVAMDGDTLATVANRQASVRRWTGTTWQTQASLTMWSSQPDYVFENVLLSGDVLAIEGTRSEVVGDGDISDTQAIFIYRRSGSAWGEERAFTGQSNQLLSMSALRDDWLVIDNTGDLLAYRWSGSIWASEGTIQPPWGTGGALRSIVIDGDRMAAKASGGLRWAGAHTLEFDGSTWNDELYFQPALGSDGQIGAMALTSNSLVGAAGDGSVDVFPLSP